MKVARSNPLSKSTQAVVIKCGDGAVLHKGKGTSFKLRKLESGARLNLILDLQTREMTIELVGSRPQKLTRCCGEAGCGGLARNSRAEACARLEHHRGASSEAPLRDYVMPGAICWLGAERQRPWSCYTCD